MPTRNDSFECLFSNRYCLSVRNTARTCLPCSPSTPLVPTQICSDRVTYSKRRARSLQIEHGVIMRQLAKAVLKHLHIGRRSRRDPKLSAPPSVWRLPAYLTIVNV